MHDQPRITTIIVMAAAVTALTGMAIQAQVPPDPADRLAADPITLWNTFMGGDSNEWGNGIARDGSGNIYVTGLSYTTWGSPLSSHQGGKDVFVAKLDSNGNRLWNTFLGSSGDDDGNGIAVDASGNVYVVGKSTATWGAPLIPFSASEDGFVVKLDSSGAVQWLAFLGGTGADRANGVATDASNNVYVVGTAAGTWGSPIVPYPTGEWYCPFAAKLSSAGGLTWSTFWGSGGFDSGNAIAADGTGNSFVVGTCYNSWGTPVDQPLGQSEACVAKLNVNGARQWNTFMGSSNSDGGNGIAVDSAGDVYVTGYSNATWGTPVDAHGGTHNDAFVARLNGSNGARRWNTFAGFSNISYGRGVAVGKAGGVYVVGESKARSGIFYDAFMARLGGDGTRSWDILIERTSANDYAKDVVVSIDGGQAFVAGESYASWGVPIVSYADGSDAYVASVELPVIFADGFESGDMSGWSVAIP